MPATVTRIDPQGAASMSRSATFRPASYREADNSIEVCWSIGAAGLRFDWLDGGYYIEELSMQPSAVRLGRLNAGACLLDSHITGSLSAVLGSVVPGSARVADGQGIARVRLATTPDVADTNAKIIDGHIRNLSVSYQVYEFQRTEKAGEHPHMLATDWEPVEISMVTVPFDAAAQVRSRSNVMPEPIDLNENNDPTPAPRRRGGVTIDLIRERCSRTDDLSRGFERELIEDHQLEPFSLRELQQRIADELIAIRSRDQINVREIRGQRGNGGALDRASEQRQHFADALYARLSGTEAPEAAREFQGASLVDIARSMLEARGERVRWLRAGQVIDGLSRAGANTSSDFAYVIANAGSRFLIDAFNQVPSPLKVLARKRDFPDFKTRYSVQAEGQTELQLVKENAEFKRTGFTQAENGSKLSTYGRIFAISRQALVNDDLGVFADMARYWARGGSELEAGYLAGMIIGNGVMMQEDAKTLYHASHRNIATTPGTLSVGTLSAARQQMRAQVNRDGTTFANVVPKYLVVGPVTETLGEQVLAACNAGTVQDVNPFSGKLELVVDPRLTGPSWRLFADPAISPVLEYGNLEGQDGLFTDARVGFDVDGVEFKARTDLGAGAVDYRGTLMNPGVG